MIKTRLAICLLALVLASVSHGKALFEGRLQLEVERAFVETEIFVDRYHAAGTQSLSLSTLPRFDFEFVSDGERLIPVRQGPVANEHPLWEYVLGAGVVKALGQARGLQLSLPVSLKQRNQDCLHNGVLEAELDSQGRGEGVFRISSETCIDLKLNFRATLSVHYQPAIVGERVEVIEKDRRNLAHRLPVRPIAELAERGVNTRGLATGGVIPAWDITVYGLLMDGVHYRGGCKTRDGDYPFCEELLTPSYSLAKSFFAGLGLMRLEKLYPGAAEARISDYVPECAATGKWEDVRFLDALSMVTGLYDSPVHEIDEYSIAQQQGFFDEESHAGKISFACDAYPKREPAGKRFVYNTATTYVLGIAMSNFLQARDGGTDLYQDVLLPWWQPLALSGASEVVRRTYDESAQAFTGFGFTWLADDLVRLAAYVNDAEILKHVDAELLNSALQHTPAEPGYRADPYRYQLGFWAKDVSAVLSCAQPTWIPYLSGYGGLNVALLPNDTIYYYVSDAGLYSLNAGLKEIHKLRPIC